jgi:Ca2+-transporting ATPase
MGDDARPWHARAVDDVAVAVEADLARGLSTSEATARLARDGRNALPETPPSSLLVVFARQLKSPLIFLLMGAAVLALFIGERTDAAVIAVVVVLNAVIGALQEGRAERSLAALKRLTGHTARVVRDGHELDVAADEIVAGDVLVLTAGDAVSADARVVDHATLQVAEAALTGESVPVGKSAGPVAVDTPLAERGSMLFAGTYVVAGRARAVGVATGPRTEIGHIAALATAGDEPPTPLERRIARLGRVVIVLAIALFVIVIVVGLLRGVAAHELLMIAISQIVGLVPEGLPVAMTVALAVGVQRMAKRKAVVRRLSAVETLGSTTVICTDKTGTLTRNEMTATTLVLADGRVIDAGGTGYTPIGTLRMAGCAVATDDDGDRSDGNDRSDRSDDDVHELLRAIVLCNDASLLPPAAPDAVDADDAPWRPIGDPTEVALVVLGMKAGLVPDELRRRHKRRAALPFDSDARMMATQHPGPRDGDDVVFVKGAPEAVLSLCARLRVAGDDFALDDAHAARVRAIAEGLAARALRVLAVAVVRGGRIEGDAGFAALHGATLLGFVGELDPPRDEVKDAIACCRAAGIRPVMVTGDHKATGLAIARAIGLADDGDEAIDGRELEALDDAALAARLPRCSVFARVQPAQKLRIVTLLQQRHDVVAMTGDGVNDAPALVRADVGVAMGRSGTEVARDAAKIVLVDDNFATLVAAVEEGRVVYRNIKKAVLLLLSTSFAEVVILLGAMALGFPPPFHAVQILWNNLVTEGLITVNLIMEPPEGDEMRRPPIAPGEPLIDRAMTLRMALMVPAISVVTLGWLVWRTSVGVPAEQVQTETFTLLALCEWFNVLNCRSATRSAFSMRLLANPWLVGGLVLGNALQALVVFAPPLQRVFRTVPFGVREVVLLGMAGSVVLVVEELRKIIVRRRRARAASAGCPLSGRRAVGQA